MLLLRIWILLSLALSLSHILNGVPLLLNLLELNLLLLLLLKLELKPENPKRMTCQKEWWLWFRRGAALVWGCVLTLSAGQLSAFSSYAGALGAALGADLAALNAAVNTGFVGHLLLGCVSGFYADRLGAVAALAHGLGTGTAGALGVWALAAWPPRALRPAATAALLCACFFLVGRGCASFYFAATSVVPHCFPARARPVVFGLLVTCFGFSGAAYTLLYQRFLARGAPLPAFFLALALVTAAVGLGAFALVAPAPTVHSVPTDEKKDSGSKEDQEEERDITGMALLREPTYVLTWLGAGLLMGAAMTFIANTRLVLLANGCRAARATSFVAYASYVNGLGRVVLAVASYFALEARTPAVRVALCQPFFFFVAGVLAVAAGALGAAQGAGVLAAALLFPLANAAVLAVLLSYIQRSFGSRHFGFNFALMPALSCVVSMGLGTITGRLYDREAAAQGSTSLSSSESMGSSGSTATEVTCVGHRCFGTALDIICGVVGLACVAFTTVWVLEMRTQLHKEQKRQREENNRRRLESQPLLLNA